MVAQRASGIVGSNRSKQFGALRARRARSDRALPMIALPGAACEPSAHDARAKGRYGSVV
jgi:hypothetical protein